MELSQLPPSASASSSSKAKGGASAAAGGGGELDGYGVTVAETDAAIAIPETEEQKVKRLEEEKFTVPDDEVLLPRPGLLEKIKGKIYEQVPELPIGKYCFGVYITNWVFPLLPVCCCWSAP